MPDMSREREEITVIVEGQDVVLSHIKEDEVLQVGVVIKILTHQLHKRRLPVDPLPYQLSLPQSTCDQLQEAHTYLLHFLELISRSLSLRMLLNLANLSENSDETFPRELS